MKITTVMPASRLATPAGIDFVRRHQDNARRAWNCETNPCWLYRLIAAFRPPAREFTRAFVEMRSVSNIKLSAICQEENAPTDPEARRTWAGYCEILRRHFPFDALVRGIEPAN